MEVKIESLFYKMIQFVRIVQAKHPHNSVGNIKKLKIDFSLFFLFVEYVVYALYSRIIILLYIDSHFEPCAGHFGICVGHFGIRVSTAILELKNGRLKDTASFQGRGSGRFFDVEGKNRHFVGTP
jgi:hypothetical protein